jgi:sensor histidine kinase YesM
MISTRDPSIDNAGRQSNKTVRAFKAFCSEIWIVPAIAVVIAILILVIGHARSQIGAKFLSSFIYAMLIGFPTAFSLNWIGFRYTERFPRVIFLIFIAVLIAIATCGSLLGAFVLQVTGIIPPHFYLREVQSSLPICLVINLVVGLSVTSYETLRHRLQDATLELRTRQVEQERANKLLLEARLSSLESRIHPHFLFNTLNSIAGLVREKRNDAAVSMIVGLSDFMRRLLDDSNRQEVPLAEELEFTQKYLDIQKVRLVERLQCSVNVPTELLTAQVPLLILQPMVENAIKHGIAKRDQGGAVRILASRSNGTLTLSVYNDGPSLSAAAEKVHSGIGISNMRTRLQSLYGDAFELNMHNQDRGVEVSVSMPFRE